MLEAPELLSWRERVERLTSILEILSQEDFEQGRAQEPWVEFLFEAWQCRMPPARIRHSAIVGSLYLGGLSHAVHQDWLRWRGVTHVVCCLGRLNGANTVNEHWKRASEARITDGSVHYKDWCINNGSHRGWGADFLQQIAALLRVPQNCVFIHCKNGRDRSAMTVFALLRLGLSLPEWEAREALLRGGDGAAHVGRARPRRRVEKVWSVRSE